MPMDNGRWLENVQCIQQLGSQAIDYRPNVTSVTRFFRIEMMS
jgi:hypothetical protein